MIVQARSKHKMTGGGGGGGLSEWPTLTGAGSNFMN